MAYRECVYEVTEPVLNYLDREDPGEIIGVYLYGSAVVSGLRPSSDIDMLVLTRRSLTGDERAGLAALLLEVSGWSGHRQRFPDVAARRPLELTCVVIDADDTWFTHSRYDFQFGEWRRDDLAAGHVLHPAEDPDVITLIATAHTAHRVLRGPPLGEVVRPIPSATLRHAVLASIPDIVDGIEGDERNALLTLARILVTLTTSEIVSKDDAADMIAPTLEVSDRWLLDQARADYLGTITEDWSGLSAHVRALAHTLADRARQHR